MAAPSVEAIQRFLDGGHDALSQKARRARAALQAGAWRDEVTRHVATPPWTQPLARRELGRCVELAVERTAAASEPVRIEILPLWTGDNEDSEPGPHWFVTHAVVIDGELSAPWEISPVCDDAELRFERRLAVEAQRWRVAHVVEVSSYAPSVELASRGKRFGVLDGELYAASAVALRPGAPLPRPTRDVPMFCQWHEPRVDGLEPALTEALRARWITTDDEGNLID